jgi:hypothetical protein
MVSKEDWLASYSTKQRHARNSKTFKNSKTNTESRGNFVVRRRKNRRQRGLKGQSTWAHSPE